MSTHVVPVSERAFDCVQMNFVGGPKDGDRHWVGTQTLRLLFYAEGGYHVYNQLGGPCRMEYGGIAPRSHYPESDAWTL